MVDMSRHTDRICVPSLVSLQSLLKITWYNVHRLFRRHLISEPWSPVGRGKTFCFLSLIGIIFSPVFMISDLLGRKV